MKAQAAKEKASAGIRGRNLREKSQTSAAYQLFLHGLPSLVSYTAQVHLLRSDMLCSNSKIKGQVGAQL